MNRIELGMKVHDLVTGFEGIVVGRYESLTGPLQYFVTPPVVADSKMPEGSWIDAQRLTTVGEGVAGEFHPITLDTDHELQG